MEDIMPRTAQQKVEGYVKKCLRDKDFRKFVKAMAKDRDEELRAEVFHHMAVNIGKLKGGD